jgi:hypothetical protein
MFRTVQRLPMLKVLAVVQIAMLARRHLFALTPAERRRAAELVRRSRQLTAAERQELLALALKLEPRAFAGAAADRLSPIPGTRRVVGGKKRR